MSNAIWPFSTTRSFAPGLSSTSRGSEIEPIPSCTVPMFSNRAETSHMIHCDMPQKRSTRPITTATAPMLIALPSHSQTDIAPTATSSDELSR